MVKTKQIQLLLALVSTGPIQAYGAFSLSQTIALSKRPILIEASPDAPSTEVKIGREGQPATSAKQDLELTRQVIMAHFDAIDAALDTRDNYGITTLQGQEIPMASEKLTLGFDAPSTPGNELTTNCPTLDGQDDVKSAHSGKKRGGGVWHVFASKGKNLYGQITRSLGIKKKYPQDMGTMASS
jgi:hypothetical protein